MFVFIPHTITILPDRMVIIILVVSLVAAGCTSVPALVSLRV